MRDDVLRTDLTFITTTISENVMSSHSVLPLLNSNLRIPDPLGWKISRLIMSCLSESDNRNFSGRAFPASSDFPSLPERPENLRLVNPTDRNMVNEQIFIKDNKM